MEQDGKLDGEVTIDVQNVGGINETEKLLEPGVTILTGKNATNRTSFLQSIMAALGSENVSIKADAEEATVRMSIDGEEYTRQLKRQNGTVKTSGTPLLDDPQEADLFAFLLESNAARRAIARGEDLRDIIMQPVDVESIERDIDRLQKRKRSLTDELSELEDAERELAELKQRRADLENSIEAKEEELAAKQAEIEEADTDIEESQAKQEQLEEIRELRSRHQEIQHDIETERESLASLREERKELESDLADQPSIDTDDTEEIDLRIDQLREQYNALEGKVSELQKIIQFNREMLDGEKTRLIESVLGEQDADSDRELTDQLLGEDEKVTCWTCGSAVQRGEIEEMADRLKDLRTEIQQDRTEIRSDLDELKEEKQSIAERREQRDRLEEQLGRVEDEIERRDSRIEDLQQRRDELDAEIADVESEVEATDESDFGDVLELHKEANRLEFELDDLRDERERVESEITATEDRLDNRGDLEQEREEVTERLRELRSRVTELETEAVEAFNEHMDDILGILQYKNIERIWLERTEQEVRSGRRKTEKSVFDLHIVRSTPDGKTFEDTVDHLSESEREVTGLVFGLAGYLVHNVHETVPFMLLDSLEAIDSDRIADLIDYFADYPEYLVVALLPEDTAAVDDSYVRVSDI